MVLKSRQTPSITHSTWGILWSMLWSKHLPSAHCQCGHMFCCHWFTRLRAQYVTKFTAVHVLHMPKPLSFEDLGLEEVVAAEMHHHHHHYCQC